MFLAQEPRSTKSCAKMGAGKKRRSIKRALKHTPRTKNEHRLNNRSQQSNIHICHFPEMLSPGYFSKRGVSSRGSSIVSATSLPSPEATFHTHAPASDHHIVSTDSKVHFSCRVQVVRFQECLQEKAPKPETSTFVCFTEKTDLWSSLEVTAICRIGHARSRARTKVVSLVQPHCSPSPQLHTAAGLGRAQLLDMVRGEWRSVSPDSWPHHGVREPTMVVVGVSEEVYWHPPAPAIVACRASVESRDFEESVERKFLTGLGRVDGHRRRARGSPSVPQRGYSEGQVWLERGRAHRCYRRGSVFVATAVRCCMQLLGAKTHPTRVGELLLSRTVVVRLRARMVRPKKKKRQQHSGLARDAVV